MERRISSFTINSSNSLYSGGNYPEGWGKSGRFHSSADKANSFLFDFFQNGYFSDEIHILCDLCFTVVAHIYASLYLARFSA